MIKQDKKSLKIAAIVISAILLGLLVFYGTYYFFISKSYSSYTDKAKTEMANITKINENSSIYTKGETIDKDKIVSSMNDSISSLQSSLSSLRSLNVTDKYRKDHDNLVKGLENNINVYKQILALSKDLNSPILSDNITQLEKYRDDCLNYYSLIYIKNTKIALPAETMDLIDKTIDFAQKQMRLNVENQISVNQDRVFLNIFNPLVEKFNEVNKDYMPEVLSIRDKGESYDNLLDSIAKAEAVTADIRATLSTTTIPKDALELYKSYIKVLDNFDQYIQSFKYAVKTESLGSGNGANDNKALDKLYSSSRDKLKTATDSYKIFSKSLQEFQNKVPAQ